MRVLLDAQLPVRLFEVLSGLGFDVIHTDSLANKNRSTDAEILYVCEKDERILVSKDRDFVDSFVVRNKPKNFFGLPLATSQMKNSFIFFKNIIKQSKTYLKCISLSN